MRKVDPNSLQPRESGESAPSEAGGSTPPWSGERDALQAIFDLLQQVKGVDFSRYRQTTVVRRVNRRLGLSKQPTPVAYAKYLEEHPEELLQLHDDLLLSITEFFRDPATFELLKKHVFPALVEQRSQRSPIRVWVPGCSTGEEVYSLAICFHEFMEEHQVKVPVQFFGTDISEANIAAARTAVYGEKLESSVSQLRIEHHFDKTPGGYRVSKALRERCVFAVQDLASDPPFANVDLVSCRNVLIYFDEELQEVATSLFYFALNASGYLQLGASENMQNFDELFSPVEGMPNLFRKRIPPLRGNQRSPWTWSSVGRARGPLLSGRSRSFENSPKSGGKLSPEALADRAVVDEYGPPGLLVDPQLQIRQFRGRVAAYLEPASGNASLKLSKMVRAELMPDLFVAIEEAKKTGASARRSKIALNDAAESSRAAVDIVVFPLSGADSELHFLISFEQAEVVADEAPPVAASGQEDAGTELFVLRRELQAVKRQLQAIIEEKDIANQELWTANEEIQSANEELQSVNEEMEAAKEELESANEELVTLNEELHVKNLALSESEARFRGLVESSADWIWETDDEGMVTYCSPRVTSLLGYLPDQMVGKHLNEFLPEVWGSCKQAPSFGGSRQVLSSIVDAKGQSIIFDTTYVSQSPSSSGGLRGVSRDVSERERASERLARSEESLALAQEIARLGHWELDLLGGEHLWSTQMYRMFGLPEVEGPPPFERFLERIHPEDRAGVVQHVQNTVESGVPSQHEWRSDPYHGEMRVFEARAIPVRREDGKVHKLVGTLLDITDKRRAEEARREVESRFRAYVDAAPDAIFVIDERGKLLEVNDAAVTLTGFTRQDLGNARLLSLLAKDEQPRFSAELQALKNTGRASAEFVFRRPSDELRHAQVEAVKLSDTRVLVFAKDITEQKEAAQTLRTVQENLHHAEKMQAVGQLAGGVAHDFNNQLTTVMAFTELLRTEVSANRTLVSYCDEVLAGIKRASDLTAQLLAYSRKGKYQSLPIDVHALVAQVSTLLRRTLDKKVDVRLSLAAGVCSTVGDPTQLQNVLLNLALNARDAMPQGGQLTIATRLVEWADIPTQGVLGTLSPGRYIELSVKDSGVGMSADVLNRVFEPFFSTKAPGKGTGMGLPSVYGAVAAHNGAIRVESQLDKGSSFFVYLPVHDPAEAQPEAPAGEELQPRRGARIIVVEDEPTLRVAVCTVLTHLGHKVKGFPSGREAVEHYRQQWRDIDLVILDMIMPVMNGKETFLALKSINPEVVALLASGYSMEGETEEMLRSGVRGFLQKPFKMEDLGRSVAEVLGVRAKSRADALSPQRPSAK